MSKEYDIIIMGRGLTGKVCAQLLHNQGFNICLIGPDPVIRHPVLTTGLNILSETILNEVHCPLPEKINIDTIKIHSNITTTWHAKDVEQTHLLSVVPTANFPHVVTYCSY